MHIEYDQVRIAFNQQYAGDNRFRLQGEMKLKRVYDALCPMLELPATPINVHQALSLAQTTLITYLAESSFVGALAKTIFPLLTRVADRVFEDNLILYNDPSYAMQFFGIKEPAARAAYEKGDISIGELFLLQPSIFTRE